VGCARTFLDARGTRDLTTGTRCLGGAGVEVLVVVVVGRGGPFLITDIFFDFTTNLGFGFIIYIHLFVYK